MTDIDTDAIRKREQAATEGPWKTGDRFGNRSLGSSVVVLAGNLPPVRLDPHRNGRNDAEFIAHARTDVPALLAKVDELTAEREHMELNPTGTAEWLKNRVNELTAALAERDAQLTQSRAQAATYANEIGTLTAENARVRQQRDGLLADLTDAGNEVDLLTAENTRLRPVIEAAKAWRDVVTPPPWPPTTPTAVALIAAVDALPKVAQVCPACDKPGRHPETCPTVPAEKDEATR